MRKNTDSFELIDLLGTGAFAHTWRVRVIEPSLLDAWGQEEVAIKIPLSKQKQIDLQNDIDLNASLHRQLTELEARNIVRYLGTWVYDGKLVMVMKYIQDGSLRNMMGSIYHRERLDFDKVLPIAKGILTGLSMIHKQRIIHRDIKPENILMDGLTPKIADFGIGRIIKTNEMASGKGTLYYMSPELLEDEGRATFNADIWSVGITIYEMLCARFPFGIDEKAPPPKVLKLILDEELKPVFPRDVSIPPGFKQIILKMLDKNPHSRYKTAEEILSDLKHLGTNADSEFKRDLAEVQKILDDPAKFMIAEKKIKELVIKYPNEPLGYLRWGEFYNKCGNFGKAVQSFQQGLEKDPQNAQLHWALGIALERKGQYKKAIQALQKAVDYGKGSKTEKYARALLESLQNKPEQ